MQPSSDSTSSRKYAYSTPRAEYSRSFLERRDLDEGDHDHDQRYGASSSSTERIYSNRGPPKADRQEYTSEKGTKIPVGANDTFAPSGVPRPQPLRRSDEQEPPPPAPLRKENDQFRGYQNLDRQDLDELAEITEERASKSSIHRSDEAEAIYARATTEFLEALSPELKEKVLNANQVAREGYGKIEAQAQKLNDRAHKGRPLSTLTSEQRAALGREEREEETTLEEYRERIYKDHRKELSQVGISYTFMLQELENISAEELATHLRSLKEISDTISLSLKERHKILCAPLLPVRRSPEWEESESTHRQGNNVLRKVTALLKDQPHAAEIVELLKTHMAKTDELAERVDVLTRTALNIVGGSVRPATLAPEARQTASQRSMSEYEYHRETGVNNLNLFSRENYSYGLQQGGYSIDGYFPSKGSLNDQIMKVINHTSDSFLPVFPGKATHFLKFLSQLREALVSTFELSWLVDAGNKAPVERPPLKLPGETDDYFAFRQRAYRARNQALYSILQTRIAQASLKTPTNSWTLLTKDAEEKRDGQGVVAKLLEHHGHLSVMNYGEAMEKWTSYKQRPNQSVAEFRTKWTELYNEVLQQDHQLTKLTAVKTCITAIHWRHENVLRELNMKTSAELEKISLQEIFMKLELDQSFLERRAPYKFGGSARVAFQDDQDDEDFDEEDEEPSTEAYVSQSSAPRACYNCGKEGHLARDCKERASPSKKLKKVQKSEEGHYGPSKRPRSNEREKTGSTSAFSATINSGDSADLDTGIYML